VRDAFWVVLAAAGIYLLAGARLTADDAIGVLAAVGAAACWAGFILLGGRLARACANGRGLTVTLGAASVVVLPVALAGGAIGSIPAEPSVLIAGLVLAALSSAIPYTLELLAMRRVPSSTYGVLMSLEPAVAAVVRERPSAVRLPINSRSVGPLTASLRRPILPPPHLGTCCGSIPREPEWFPPGEAPPHAFERF